MPKAMHDSLKKGARKKGLSKKQERRYIYGTLKKKKGKVKRKREKAKEKYNDDSYTME